MYYKDACVYIYIIHNIPPKKNKYVCMYVYGYVYVYVYACVCK